MHRIPTNVLSSPARHMGWRVATSAISLTILTSLLLACAPAAPPAPAAPAKPAAPAAAPAAPAAPAPAAPAKAGPARVEPKGAVTLVLAARCTLRRPQTEMKIATPTPNA
jgi:hypothetical protein